MTIDCERIRDDAEAASRLHRQMTVSPSTVIGLLDQITVDRTHLAEERTKCAVRIAELIATVSDLVEECRVKGADPAVMMAARRQIGATSAGPSAKMAVGRVAFGPTAPRATPGYGHTKSGRVMVIDKVEYERLRRDAEWSVAERPALLERIARLERRIDGLHQLQNEVENSCKALSERYVGLTNLVTGMLDKLDAGEDCSEERAIIAITIDPTEEG